MTLIAGVKGENEGCIIFDYRLTRPSGSQYDAANKFAFYDNRLALFMAGQVLLLDKIIDRIQIKGAAITHENIDDADGIFSNAVIEAFNGIKKECDSSLMGVHVDNITDSFKIFRCDIISIDGQIKCKIIPNSDFKWQVIGSGQVVAARELFPKIDSFDLDEIFIRCRKRWNLFQSTLAVENEIKKRLNIIGPDTYKRRGISPVMNLSIIEGGYLAIVGRTVKGKAVRSSNTRSWRYEYRADVNGNAELIDHKNNECVKVLPTDSYFPVTKFNDSVRFDPEGLEGEEVFFPSYTLSQWIIAIPGQKTVVLRYVHRTQYAEWQEEYAPVREQISCQSEEFDGGIQASNINDYGFNISDVDLAFEEQLKQSSLFDGDFLKRYLSDDHPFIIFKK